MPSTKVRRQRGEGGLYHRASDGMWVGVVDLGRDPITDKRIRKTVARKRQADAIAKLAELKRDVAEHGTAPDNSTTVTKWLTYWLSDIARPRLRPRTFESYQSLVKRHLIPRIGRHKIDQLKPQHVRDLARAMVKDGASPSTALKAHWLLSGALDDARAEGLIRRNVVDVVQAPRRAPNSRGALTLDEARKVLLACREDLDDARFALALLLGGRQGEILGMQWHRTDLLAGVADLSWQLQRFRFRHGCAEAPCRYTQAGACPARELDVPSGFEHQQLDGGLSLARPKTSAGSRLIPIPAPAVFYLRQRLIANPGPADLVFTRDGGRPIDPAQDAKAWHALLDRAGVRQVPLHAARHTTATTLLELGVSPKVIGELLGQSSMIATQGYLHVSHALAAEAMDRLGGLFPMPKALEG